MIKQIGAKKIESVLSNHLTSFGYKSILSSIPSPSIPSNPIQKQMAKPTTLPPLSQKPLVEQDQASSRVLDLIPEAEEGYLLIGDVVTLIAFESESSVQNPSILFGEGIAQNNIDCVPLSLFSLSEKIQFRLCQFRIEPIRQYGYNSFLKLCRKSNSVSKENLAKLEKATEEEQEDNEINAASHYGKIVNFGDKVQLRHIHSNCFVTTSKEVSRERGCLSVVLDSNGNEGSWFELKPCSLIKRQGEAVKYSDSFSLTVTYEKEKYYLHMGSPKSWKDEEFFELNASSSYTHWHVRKFLSHSVLLQNPGCVATGDSFRIIFKQNDGFLSVSPRLIEEILPDDDIRMTKVGKDKKESSSVVYIEKKKTCMSIWELIRENPLIGGMAEKDKTYRIKNVATGLLLSMNRSGHINLTSDQSSTFTLFKLVQEPSDSIYHTFKTIIKIECSNTRKVLMSGSAQADQSLFFSSEEYTCIPIESSFNRKQDTKTAFILYDEPEESTIYVYQISSLLPKIITFYRFVKHWGSIKRGSTLIPSYELAKSTEAELESQVDFMIKVLNKLSRQLLKEDSLLEEHQESIRLTGFLEILLKFVMLLDKKLELPSKLPVDAFPRNIRKSKVKIIQEGAKYLKSELMLFPAAIGLKHFSKLSKEIYIVIYKSIKDNLDSCIELQKCQEFFSSQLCDFKEQVGVLLKELYKLSSGSIAKSNPHLFKVWVDQIRALNENEDNLNEQGISLKILAFLCRGDQSGIPANQNCIGQYFYSAERDFTILKGFIFDEKDPILGFYNDKMCSFGEFLANNQDMSALALEDKSKYMLISPETLKHSRRHLNYVSSIFEFITNLCLSRNESLINKAIEILGLNYDHLSSVISNNRCHSKVRTFYLRMIWVLYFDKESQQVISKSQQRCFLWDSEKLKLEPDDELHPVKETSLEKIAKKPVVLSKVISFIQELWVDTNVPWTSAGLESPADKTRFVIELIRFSKNLIDYSYVTFTFVDIITPKLLNLLGGSSQSNNGWVNDFKLTLNELNNEKLNLELIESIIEFFQVRYHARIDSEVREKLEEYCSNPEGNPVSPRFKKNEMDLKGQNLEYETRENNNEYLKEPNKILDTEKISQASLDTVLLNLIFNKAEDSLKDKIIRLLMFNLDLDKTLLKELSDIILIPHCELREDYKTAFNLQKQCEQLLKFIVFLDVPVNEDDSRENPQILSARKNIESNIKQLKFLISHRREVSTRRYLQKIYKNLGLHNYLIRFFVEDWPWVKKSEGFFKINDDAISLYSLVSKTLQHFAYNSQVNQECLYDYLPQIELFKKNRIGIKSLISEIIKCKRNLKSSNKIIENLFLAMSKEPNPMENPDNLLVLKSLIHDEGLKFYPVNQTAIIKSLLVTRNICNVFSGEASLDLSKYSSKGIKFFSMIIDIIARCAIFNEYSTHQARRLIPFKVLIREINNTSMLLIKKVYLHYLFYVYLMETPTIESGLTDHEVEEFIFRVVLHDIAKYRHYIDHLTIISLKDMYDPITPKKQIKSQQDSKKQKESKINSLTREQAESLEYWKYINSHKPDTPRISSGLICVIKDITMELKSHNKIFEGISFALAKVKNELQEMVDILFEKMHSCEDIDMDFMIKEIVITLFEIPYFFVDQDEASDLTNENECYNRLLNCVKEYIEKLYIPFDDFINNHFTVPNGEIDKVQFLFLIKKTLKLPMKVSEIELVTRKFDVEQIYSSINISQISPDLKALFIGNPYVVKKDRVVVEEPPVITHEESNNLLQEYISTISKRFEEEQNDIYLMVRNVKVLIIDPALKKNDSAVLLKFISNLSNAFSKKEHKLYLINMLKYIVLQEIEKNELNEDAITYIQNVFANEEVISICFNEFTKETDQENTLSALELLILMVKNNNSFAKQKILDYLVKNSSKIFSFIRASLREVQEYLLSSNSRNPTKKRRTLLETQLTYRSGKKNLRQINLTHKLIQFLQSCCNNCFTPFQEFLQIQNPQNKILNIDLVSEISQFLVSMKGFEELKSLDVRHNYLSELAIQSIRCLADCCQGPCTINQVLLGQRRKLYEFMNWLIEKEEPNFSQKNVWIDVYNEAIIFLNALIEANTNIKIAKIFIHELSLDLLNNHSALIWNQIVRGRERVIYQNNKGFWLPFPGVFRLSGRPPELYEKEVIEIGFWIHILLLTLQYLHPSQFKIKYSKLVEKNETVQNRESLRPGFTELIREKFKFCCYSKVDVTEKIDMALAQDFYYSNIATVEINIRDSLTKLFFRVPTECRYLTYKSRKDVIQKAKVSSHQEKIEDFINKIKICEVEMLHQQGIALYPFLDALVSHWRFYGKLSYVIVLIINVILLATVEHDSDTGNEWSFTSNIDSRALIVTVSVIQIILATLVYFCYLLEYMPVIKYRAKLKSKGSQYERYLEPDFNRIKGTELMKEVLLRTSTKENEKFSSLLATLEVLFLDFDSLYNFIYLVLSVLCWIWPLLYSFLLLDLVKRNEDLKNILRSITLNYKQLILTTILAVIIIYGFTIVAFLSFPEVYSDAYSDVATVTYCNDIFACFISNFVTGIRMGGGIGDALVQPKNTDSEYWTLMIFNLLYFILIINILLNIIFGIIIDTFGELRDENQARMKDIKENCFICGNQRYLFEGKRIDWTIHTSVEHNPYAYLAFLVYLRNKDIDDCSGAEKYVKEKLEENDTSFFPLTALSLLTEDEKEEDKMVGLTKTVSSIKSLAIHLLTPASQH